MSLGEQIKIILNFQEDAKAHLSNPLVSIEDATEMIRAIVFDGQQALAKLEAKE